MDTNIPSCLMLAAELSTPVSLSSIFDPGDLKDTGIEFFSHITILFSHTYLDKDNILNDIRSIQELRDREFSIEQYLSSQRELNPKPVFDLFDLSSFSNDSDYVVLRLKEDNGLYDILNIINSSLSKKYDIQSDFGTHKPHLSLAELQPGISGKYLESKTLHDVLRDSVVKFEDLVFSYDFGESGFKQYDLTQFNNVDRYFRIAREKRIAKELEE